MRKSRNPLAASVMAVSLILGCGEHLTPSEVAGTYTLRTVEGRQPPYLILATIECDVFVVGGTMMLTEAGAHEIVVDTPIDCTRGGGEVTMAGRTYPGTYELRGGSTIRFSSPIPDGADLVYSGTATGERVTVTLPDLGSGLTPDLLVTFAR